MTQLLYCRTSLFGDPAVRALPGVERYSYVTRMYGIWVIPVDRTGTIQVPFRMKSFFPMPIFRAFPKSYEEICNDRARELLASAEKLGINIKVLYSGGIDSTCLLVSLLKHATPEQKKHITVLLSHESIIENTRFYEEHIRGKLRVDSSVTFGDMIGENDMLLSAEHNDLVMGNASVSAYITRYGPRSVHEKYTRERMIEFFSGPVRGNTEIAAFYVDIFERLARSSPVPIVSSFDFLWWYNFATKWQGCYAYMLLFTTAGRAPQMSQEYLDTRFISFYNTEAFQLWSMNNQDKRIKDTWRSYKWVVKDVIYDYTKDAEYRDNKTKVRSLRTVLKQQNQPYRFIDENIQFRNDLKPGDYFESENDFI